MMMNNTVTEQRKQQRTRKDTHCELQRNTLQTTKGLEDFIQLILGTWTRLTNSKNQHEGNVSHKSKESFHEDESSRRTAAATTNESTLKTELSLTAQKPSRERKEEKL